jgi:hypothetical protein
MTFWHEQLDVYPLNIAEGNGKATAGDRRRENRYRFRPRRR